MFADGVPCNEQEHPEWVGIYLNTLSYIPGKTISMEKIVHDAHSDIGIILHPGRAD